METPATEPRRCRIMFSMGRQLPAGTVTFLFSDVEGSTRLLRELGPEGYAQALAAHRRVLREAFDAHGGTEVDTQGDAFFFAFRTAPDALAAAADARERLAPGPIRVRVGIHTGTPLVTQEGYIGVDVHRAARIATCGHGGQILVSSSTAGLVESERLRDLGLHRLKDLSGPERIYQLGDDEFPPLKSLHQTNLPIPTTPFLGREKELGEVIALMSRDDVRLLTLTGAGGTGKTRLGAQAAGALAERYPHGVWWIPLAPLRDASLVVETAAQTLGAQDGLADHIGDKAMLLLFDNFEQVIDASSDLASLLGACPNLDVLVTSREPLHVSGEQEYAVPPFAHEEGVGFFLARARAVDASFQIDDAVSEICHRLDDLPLALELAAARVKALSPEQILERLEQRLPLLTGGARDLPERQRTLHAAIQWSYELLTSDEQRLFARLAVFRGGCTLETAERIAEADVDTLQSLVDKSLVRRAQDRFWMLETIREYATERLERSGEADDFRRCHAHHFLALAEEAYPEINSSSPKKWLDRLDDEHDNLRAALDELEATGQTQLALQLAGALWRFWQLRGHVTEAARRLDALVSADESPTAARARALLGAAGVALERGELAKGGLLGEEALTLNRRLGDAWGIAFANHVLAYKAQCLGEWETARERFEETLRSFRALGDDHMVGIAIDLLGLAYFKLGDRDRAVALEKENLRRARATGNARVEAKALGAMGMYIVDASRIDEALPFLVESTRIYRHLGGDFDEVAQNLESFARAAAVVGEADAAVRILSAASSLLEEIGMVPGVYEHDLNEETLAIIRRDLDEAAFAEAWEAGRSLEMDDAFDLARNTLGQPPLAGGRTVEDSNGQGTTGASRPTPHD